MTELKTPKHFEVEYKKQLEEVNDPLLASCQTVYLALTHLHSYFVAQGGCSQTQAYLLGDTLGRLQATERIIQEANGSGYNGLKNKTDREVVVKSLAEITQMLFQYGAETGVHETITPLINWALSALQNKDCQGVKGEIDAYLQKISF